MFWEPLLEQQIILVGPLDNLPNWLDSFPITADDDILYIYYATSSCPSDEKSAENAQTFSGTGSTYTLVLVLSQMSKSISTLKNCKQIFLTIFFQKFNTFSCSPQNIESQENSAVLNERKQSYHRRDIYFIF